jgi:hypothetical protein
MTTTKPIPSDGDEDPPDEPEIEDVLDDEKREFYWTDDQDEIRRYYILIHMANSDMDGKILVENMNLVYNWCVKGELPKKSEKPKTNLLKVHDKAD